MGKNLSILIYSLASGGAERVVSILLEELKSKYNITLVLMNDTIFYDVPSDVNIKYIEKSNPTESGIKKLLKLPFLAFKYVRLCKENNTDISLSFMNRPNYINTISKILGNKSKVIISERIAPSQEYKTDGLKDKISRKLISYLYPKADKIVPNAIGIMNDLVEKFHINSSSITVVNNPIDISKVISKQNDKVDFRDENFSFITIGRIQYQKNHKLLIDTMRNIEAKLYIIGDGELRDVLENQIKELKLENKVILLGREENPYKYISKADCFVFSSLYEGFPNVLLEALACDLPVISSDCQSGPREILAPSSDVDFQLKEDIELVKYGILTAVNNKNSLEKAMKLMINDDTLRDAYAQKAKLRAREFDKDKIISKWIEVINR
ncbi:MAG: glycosyltransferase [Campylobacterota bacterium]|nr:glycosyltransferase [Campylobacterota bacterium]